MKGKACEDEIDAYARKLEFDDWYIGVGYRCQLLDGSWRGHTLEKGGNVFEKVLSSHVLWYNDEGVYIGASLESAYGRVKAESELSPGP